MNRQLNCYIVRIKKMKSVAGVFALLALKAWQFEPGDVARVW